ncbi:transposase [Streptomyces sp. NPDC046237]|uniref:transposase n=1 Tax=Streptomyces sp. NPDC046237 TaxID=3154914 RepID=UPI0034101677
MEPAAGGQVLRSRRPLIDDIRFRVRTGVRWRDMPAVYGPWGTVTAGRHAGNRNAPWS